ncbi:MAG: hypothetical protein KF824_13605 [Fimbriimonadaceae bacterium]|nr:MAG: hypothetical protein KF824_13605 [Fimbriimonadaceae bacterium]
MAASLFVFAMLGPSALSSLQTPALNLEFRGGTLSTLAKDIEAQTGWKLNIHPDVANEVVVVYSNGKETEDIVKQIAKVTATIWTLNGDEMQVLPDVTLRNQQWQASQQAYAQQVIKARQTFLDSMKKRTIKDEDGEEYEYEPELEQKILSELIAGAPLQSFTSLQPGGRIVLSSNPNRIQVALGRFNAQDVQEWIKQHNESVKLMNDPTFGDDDEGMGVDPEYMNMIMGMMPKQEEIKEPPAKMLLVLSRSRRGMFGGGGITCTAKVMGRTGKTLLQTSTSFGSDYYSEFTAIASEAMAPASEQAPKKDKKPGDDLKIEWSEETKQVKDALKLDFDPSAATLTMPKKAREILMRPDLYEPMRYELGDGLIETAKLLKKPLVAALPDEIYQFTNELSETVGEFREFVESHDVVESEADGWWMLTPKDPAEVRADRVSRTALAQMLALGQNRMFLPLDPIADFVYQYPNASENSVASNVMRMFAPQIFMSIFGETASTDHLRLYGSLSRAHRNSLKAGTPLQVSQMPQATRTVVEQLVFGADGKISAVNAETALEPVSVSQMMQGMMGAGMSMGSGGIGNEEPTEVFPNGLPPAGRLAMKVHKTQYLVAVSTDGSAMKMNMPFGRMELAVWGMLSKNPSFMAELGNMDSYFRNMRAGYRNELKFAMFLTPSLGFSGELLDIEEPDMNRKYSIYDLPDGLKQQVAGDITELENSPFGKLMQMMGDGGFGGGGGTIKP